MWIVMDFEEFLSLLERGEGGKLDLRGLSDAVKKQQAAAKEMKAAQRTPNPLTGELE